MSLVDRTASPIERLALPWAKLSRASGIAIVSAPTPVVRGKKVFRRPAHILTIRTGDIYADHAMADLVLKAFEVAEAAAALLQDGVTDDFGTFTYDAPPRLHLNALQRLKQALGKSSPPPPRFRCGICRVKQ
jgi:hypothetical protein